MKVILVLLLAVMLKPIQSQRTPNSIFEFNFLFSQCSPNNFTDLSTNILGNLEKKNNQLGCLNSNGLKSGTFVSSEKNVSSLSKTLGNDSYTVELWIQPQLVYIDSPLLTIGSDLAGIQQDKCQNNNLKIAQTSKDANSKNVTMGFSMVQCRLYTTKQKVVLSDEQGLESAWYTVPVYNGVPAITHVVITVEVKNQLRYANYPNTMARFLVSTFSINGGASFSSARADVQGDMYDFTARAWDRSKHLMLMDTYSGADKWGGNVYYLVLYNRVLTAAEITQNYQAGLPNNPQWVRNETVHIRQNGEVGDHSATPEYYLKPIPYYELEVITLPIDDLDDQRISPNYNPAVGATAQVYLTSLPTKGQLYYMDGTEIKAVKSKGALSIKLPYDRTTYSFAVRYRPPLNQYSKTNSEVFSSLSFYVIEGGTNIRSDTHTISIIVTRVNQPPVATPAAQTIFAGKTYILTVEGTDSDTVPIQNDISNAIVTAVPTQGMMYRLDGNGVIQKNIQITAGMDLGVNLKVAYIYTGPQALVWGGSLPFVGSDQFTFALKDMKGQLSAPATFKLTVNAAVVATPLAASAVVQRQSTDIPLSITDNGDVKHRLCVKIIRLPLHGELLSSGGDALNAGDLIQSAIYQPVKTSEYVKSYSDASITYRSDENYFNFPRTSLNGTVISAGPDSFEYSICALDIYSVQIVCIAESAKVTQQVNAKNRNRETKVFFDTPPAGGPDMLTVKAVKGHKGSMEDGTMTTLSGFRLVDDDKGIDKIRATVKTAVGGRVALNPTALTEVDLKCAPALSAWKCEGDGEGDAVVTFVGTSYAVQRALNGMTYYSETQKTTDTISVRLYDGVGGDCLSEASQGTNSYREECFTASVAVSVEVLAYEDGSDGKSAMFSTTMQIIGLVIIILVTLSCAYCGWSWCQEKYAEKEDWRSRNKKRAAIAARKEKRTAKKEEKRARKLQKLQKQNNRVDARAAGRSKRSRERDYYSDDSVEDGYSGDEQEYEQEYDEEYGEQSSVDDIEMQRMEAAAGRVQKENKRNAQDVKKSQLRLALAQQQKKLDEVTEEIVQLEEQYPDYSSPPRPVSPSRSHRHSPAPVSRSDRGTAHRGTGGSGFRSQAEYDRHMAMAAHQMRGASPERHHQSSPHRNISPSSPHQQRSPPRRAPSNEPYMTPPRGHRGGSSSRAYNVDAPRF